MFFHRILARRANHSKQQQPKQTAVSWAKRMVKRSAEWGGGERAAEGQQGAEGSADLHLNCSKRARERERKAATATTTS